MVDTYNDEGKDPFAKNQTESLRIKPGVTNTIRFLAEFDKWHKAWKHPFIKVDKDGSILTTGGKANKEAGEKYKGSFVCIQTKQNLSKKITCPLCDAGLKPKAMFGVAVLDRATNTAKLLESHLTSVYNEIRKFYNDNGTILNIDFKISSEGSGKETRYGVTPLIKTAKSLTEEENAMADDIDVAKFFQSKTRQEILDTLVGKEEAKEEEAVEEDGKVTPF